MFKDKFVQLLQERGISALRVSADTGIPKSIVYEWRNGVREPSSDNLAKLSHYFDVPVDALIGTSSGVLPDTNEKELILLLRAARNVSGEEREALIEQFRQTMDDYFAASKTETEAEKEVSNDRKRRKKSRGPGGKS